MKTSASLAGFQKIIFGGTFANITDFEQFATRAKQSGATHVDIGGLPRSYWEYDQPGDPYPAWTITNNSLLKVATPTVLKKYLPADFSEKCLGILEGRSAVLKKLGLKASFSTADPAMLPEAVFTDHPLWRGARVDHPARSRAARFAPTIDDPEVRAFYSEAVSILIRRCPEIDLYSIGTNDCGSGLDWSPGLYSGSFGNSLYRERSMDERLRDYLDAVQAGAREAGGGIEVRIFRTREPDPLRISRKLERGTAVENLEGPEGTPFMAGAGTREGTGNLFSPVYDIPQPVLLLNSLMEAAQGGAPRLHVGFAGSRNRDLYFTVYDRFRAAKPADELEKLALLKEIAVERAGSEKASDLLHLWLNVDEASRLIKLLDTGGIIFDLGCVHQRWLTRPFVPFPAELTEDEKSYFRPFLFQALDEDLANSLADVQATDVYTGWSGRHFLRRVTAPLEALIKKNAALADRLGDERLARRFDAFNCVVRNARNAISYQAQLDRVRQLGIKPLPHSVVGTQPDWDRQLMLETARAELDNTAVLMNLLRSDPNEFLRLAATKEEEDIRLLGRDILDQLQKKLNLMNARWEDYKRVFTIPNW